MITPTYELVSTTKEFISRWYKIIKSDIEENESHNRVNESYRGVGKS